MPRPVRSRRRLQLGAVLLLVGLVLLGYVGWQLVGTSWVSRRAHAAGVEALREQWEQGRDHADVDHHRVLALVRVPRFGDDVEVPLVEGTSPDDLAAGFGHVEGTAEPGARGNLVIAGHRVTHGEPLRDMPRLEPGDRVVVETRTATHTYVLDTAGDALSVPFTADWVLDARPRNPDAGGTEPPADAGPRLLTLVTCAELFHTDQRLVAFGHLVSSTPSVS
ncbi:class E sortase [Nocardioides sp. 503]|uniref:class E sortase n=1 Tax=Nocardioides sp. 503 TaxID=2508326 RepID=UPI001FD70A19|nr:class E sortase [Nocardioides sp. 503]